ncbi:MAG: HD domain-containing protein [candidate division WOR-3 bacterium]
MLETLRSLGRAYERLISLKQERRLYLVGGVLRDLLLRRPCTDFDFAVSGSGIDFAREFARRTRSSLVVLSEPDDEARVVYRRTVTFDFNGLGDKPIEDDLQRRDFTINALACEILPDSAGEIIDLFGCRADIANRIVRPVSSSSLAADPLRLLRAIRFALELGFAIDPDVYEQAQNISLNRVAGERIGAELLRIMEQPGSFVYIKRLVELGRLVEILPALAEVLSEPELREHSLQTYFKIEEIVHGNSFFSRFEPEWQSYFAGSLDVGAEETPPAFRRALLKLAGLLHDLAKPRTRFLTSEGEVHFYGHDSLGSRQAYRMAIDRLRLSRQQAKVIRTLVQEHMRLHLLATAPDLSERAIRRYFRDLGQEAFGLMILCYADGWATAGRTLHLEDTITRMIEQRRAEEAKQRIKRFVTGHDLIALGMKPGPAFKVILQELEDLQVEGRIRSKEEGLEYLKNYLAQGS